MSAQRDIRTDDPASPLREQALALAALVQSVALVDQIARTGQAEPRAMEASLGSLFSYSAETVLDAFGGDVGNLELGLRSLRDLLSGNDYAERPAIMRYCIGALHLQRKLISDADTAALMRNRLSHADKAREFNSSNISALSPSLASIYEDTLSRYRFRIQITGSAQQLRDEANAQRIRALLLAAIRAVYLWRQHGGSRWSLLLRRGKLARQVRDILKREIPH